ncbi:DUF3097 domain-containing protein [Curtobacterium ammoniigenes]|uniref:DUF3097 domain-containing protein n=1 Tax=Curtobacterium ammoniigenes TaxID=395387 RepID=UPI000834E4C3|nr:DUF3097 domain-containing protein [Curtobacterium ammoniigenes]
MHDHDRYGDDVLAGDWRSAGRKLVREIPFERGMILEDPTSGWAGAAIRLQAGLLDLEDWKGRTRSFPFTGQFLFEGELVRLGRPVIAGSGSRARTASGSFAVDTSRAKTALPSRILVEGRHDAELVEKVWGADLRNEGVVVEYLAGVDNLEAVLAEFRPAASRRAGVLVDHLVAGSKESRIAERVHHGPWGEHVLVLGHPYVDVWQSVKPARLGLRAWPTVPRTIEWKHGICAALGWPHADQADIARAWQRVLGQVRTFTDLEPSFLGRVEELIDFVTVGR